MNFKQQAMELYIKVLKSGLPESEIETALRTVRNETIDEVMNLYASDRKVSFLQALRQLKETIKRVRPEVA